MCSFSDKVISGIEKCISQQHEIGNYFQNLLNRRSHYPPEEPIKQKPQKLDEIEGIPVQLLTNPGIQEAIKDIVCKDADTLGHNLTAKKYYISLSIIKKWNKGRKYETKVENGKRSAPEEIINDEINHSQSEENTEDLKIEQMGAEKYTNTIKKAPNIYQNLNKREIRRLTYDLIKLGEIPSSRKWGFHLGAIRKQFHKTFGMTKQHKVEWMQKKRQKIKEQKEQLRKIGEKKIENKVRTRLQLNPSGISFTELLNFGLERGIAIAAILHNIDIFELEFLIKRNAKDKYNEMKGNSWFLGPPLSAALPRLPGELKLEIINCCNTEGSIYASKKYHVSMGRISSFSKSYLKYGLEGIDSKDVYSGRNSKTSGMDKADQYDNPVLEIHEIYILFLSSIGRKLNMGMNSCIYSLFLYIFAARIQNANQLRGNTFLKTQRIKQYTQVIEFIILKKGFYWHACYCLKENRQVNKQNTSLQGRGGKKQIELKEGFKLYLINLQLCKYQYLDIQQENRLYKEQNSIYS